MNVGHYFRALGDGDSDDTILAWHNSLPVNMIHTAITQNYDKLRFVHTVKKETKTKILVKDELAKK